MRIAVVVNTSWNIYNFRMGLIRALLAAGHEVHAVAPPDDFSEKLVQAGCQYHPVTLDNKGSNPFRDVAFMTNLYGIYKKIRPDAVLHFTIKPNIYGTLAAQRLKIPVINNVSGLGTVFLRDNATSRIAHTLYKLAFRYPKKVFFQNPDDRQLFLDKGFVRPEITGMLPGSGINPASFVPAPFQRNQPFVFLVIARLLYDKGIVEYAEAARQLKQQGVNADFRLLGFLDTSPLGIPEPQLNEWMRNGWIQYLGTTDDVRPFIQQADCVVLPSYREGTPRTLLEAACLAKPLVATRVPGCIEVVNDSANGFLCEARNADDLASAMRRMMALPDQQLRQMGAASRQLVTSKFDEKLVIQSYFAALP